MLQKKAGAKMANWETKGWCNGCQKEVEVKPPCHTFMISGYRDDGSTFDASSGGWFCSPKCLSAWAGRLDHG